MNRDKLMWNNGTYPYCFSYLFMFYMFSMRGLVNFLLLKQQWIINSILLNSIFLGNSLWDNIQSSFPPPYSKFNASMRSVPRGCRWIFSNFLNVIFLINQPRKFHDGGKNESLLIKFLWCGNEEVRKGRSTTGWNRGKRSTPDIINGR